MNENLPAFVVLQAKHYHPKANVQAISARLWSAGFLSGKYAGVSLRSSGDPVLFINNPDGVSTEVRRAMLDGLAEMNQLEYDKLGDPETKTRIAQYEMAFRMQSSVPELTDLSKEPASTWEMYGDDAHEKPGSFANTCLMARRLAERGVRFVQVYHRGWDVHGNLPEVLPSQCKEIDQPCWALVQDLKQRGMLDDTLVILAGEFGRTIYSPGQAHRHRLRPRPPSALLQPLDGRRRASKAAWCTAKPTISATTSLQDPVHVRDFQATILHQFGIDHERFSYNYQGLDVRLTGVEKAEVVKEILA